MNEQFSSLKTTMVGLELSSPILTASGTCNFGRELRQFFDLEILGGIVVKGITLAPRVGNPGTRLVETPAGLLNSIGLENPGLENFISDEMPFLRKQNTHTIVNISGNTEEEYAIMASRLDKVVGVSALEVNISCPNVKSGGMAFGSDPKTAAQVTALVRQQTKLPLIVKLSPNVSDIASVAQAVQDAGADAVSLINTILGMSIDLKLGRPILQNTFGGLSGPAIKPIALRMVWQVYRAVGIPIIGMGGISTWQDAAEFLLAGATAVSIGTASMINPLAIPAIHEGLLVFAKEQGVRRISELVGGAHRNKQF